MPDEFKVAWTDLAESSSWHCHRSRTEKATEDTIYLGNHDVECALVIYLTPDMVVRMANTMLTDDERSRINVPVVAAGGSC